MSQARIHLSAALLIFAACAGAPRPQEAPESALKIRRSTAPLEHPRANLLEDLDRIVQARFLNVRPEDVEKRNLGAGRYAALGTREPHGILRNDLPEFRPVLENIHSAGWTWASYVAEVRRDGIGTIVGPIVEPGDAWSRFVEGERVRDIAGVAALKRDAVRSDVAGFPVEARLIMASDERCLRCHRHRVLGEPLGVVVYAFRNIRPWFTTTGR